VEFWNILVVHKEVESFVVLLSLEHNGGVGLSF